MKKVIAVICLLVLFLLPCIASAATLSGKIKQRQLGKEQVLEHAIVLIGQGIWLDASEQPYDIVRGGKVVAKAVTDSNGDYVIDAPEGQYTMIIWKEHYIPADGIAASVPGTRNGTITYDDSSRASERHKGLR
jgi:hypothetical protein